MCDMGTIAAQHNTMLWKFRNDHAPEKTETVKMKQTMRWYNDGIKGFKRNRGKAERRWLQHRDYSITNATYREECRLVRNRYRSPIDKAKTEYYSGKVQECTGDQEKLFESLNPLQNQYNKSNTKILTH